MVAVTVGMPVDDDQRRLELYSGVIHVLPPTDGGRALCELAARMLEAAFHPFDPRSAQYEMEVEEFVERFAPVKPAFIHSDETIEILRRVVVENGCDPQNTYLDVPRLRGVTSDGYLTSGVGYAHHPHRDTWYAAPLCQINWWLPIYPFSADAGMEFHPGYWSRGIKNGSSQFDYYLWNSVGRKEAARHVRQDTRVQPRPEEELVLEPALRFVCEVGATIAFSAAQLHSTVPNTSGVTRYSIDFRTVDLRDLESGRGASNVDSKPHGTSLRDFRRVADLSPMPEEVVAAYDDRLPESGDLVFRPR